MTKYFQTVLNFDEKTAYNSAFIKLWLDVKGLG